MYKLEDFNTDWLIIGENPIVAYPNLRYSDCTSRVKVANSDGVWSDDEMVLEVHILPPLHLSIWTYCAYALSIIGCSSQVVMYFKRRSNDEHQRQTEKFKQKKERKIYRMEVDFFMNVAHEAYTPLILTKGSLENIILEK